MQGVDIVCRVYCPETQKESGSERHERIHKGGTQGESLKSDPKTNGRFAKRRQEEIQLKGPLEEEESLTWDVRDALWLFPLLQYMSGGHMNNFDNHSSLSLLEGY